MANTRHQLKRNDLDSAVKSVVDKLRFRVFQKGMGSMASSHEILGIINEEVQEFVIEVHSKSDVQDRKIEELKDIAVAAIFGIASITSGGVDW